MNQQLIDISKVLDKDQMSKFIELRLERKNNRGGKGNHKGGKGSGYGHGRGGNF
jgi:hypothetical protein